MHIVLALVGIITAISVWYWRMKMVSRAARDGADLARAAGNLPRRLRFQHKAGREGLKLVEDPREAATVIMLEIARARGEISAEHKAVMRTGMVEEFGLPATDAEELITQAGWLTREAPPSHAVVQRMANLLLRTPGIGPKEIVDLDGMLVAVSEAEGAPSKEQLALLQAFRDVVGLQT